MNANEENVTMTSEVVRHVAKLSRLALSDEEIETLKTEIKTIMTYRLVLLEKAYDELITIKNILLNT